MNFGISYGIVLIIFLTLGFLAKFSSKNLYFYILDFLIAIPAFFVRPDGSVMWDSIRFINLLDTMRTLNLGNITAGLRWGLTSSVYSNQPLVVFYIWLMSFFKNNGVFFYITTLIFLIVLSILITASLEKMNINNKFIGVLVQFIVLMIFNLFFEVEGVRNFLAFAIFATSFFIDINSSNKKTKFKCWLAYFIAYSFHPAIIPFIIFRVVLLFRNKIFNNLIKILALGYNFFISKILFLLDKIPFISIFLINKTSYFYGQNNYSANASRREVLFTSFILIYLIIELIVYRLQKTDKNINQNYMEFYIICLLFTIGSFFNKQIYLRTIMFLLFLSIPIKIRLFNSKVYLYKETQNYMVLWSYKYFSIVFAFVMFVYWYIQTYSIVPALSF